MKKEVLLHPLPKNSRPHPWRGAREKRKVGKRLLLAPGVTDYGPERSLQRPRPFFSRINRPSVVSCALSAALVFQLQICD